jgi:hypothetical protein
MATAALKFAKSAKGDVTYAPQPTTTMYKAELTNGNADSTLCHSSTSLEQLAGSMLQE